MWRKEGGDMTQDQEQRPEEGLSIFGESAISTYLHGEKSIFFFGENKFSGENSKKRKWRYDMYVFFGEDGKCSLNN